MPYAREAAAATYYCRWRIEAARVSPIVKGAEGIDRFGVGGSVYFSGRDLRATFLDPTLHLREGRH